MAIRLKTLKQMRTVGLIPWSRPTVWKLIKEGKLPRPVILGLAHLWEEQAVELAMAKIIAEAAQQSEHVDADRLARKQAIAANARKAITRTPAA